MNGPIRSLAFLLLIGAGTLPALEPGDVIINEVYFNPQGYGKNHFEAVELLVVKDQADLNSLSVSDRDFWERQTEDQCTFNDQGRGFLGSVASGTLIVIFNGTGTDDVDGRDGSMRFYAKSSLFCNIAPTTNAFALNDAGDNVQVFQSGKALDFIKYRASDRPNYGLGHPGPLQWEGGYEGVVSIGKYRENTGIRFLGNRADLNDFHATWQTYPETYLESNNLGKPNGGKNTTWIESLRKAAIKPKNTANAEAAEQPK